MKRLLTRLSVLLFIFCLIPQKGFSQTTLAAGDIAFVSFNLDNTPTDVEVSFVLLEAIDASTVINFTDHGWQDGSGFITGFTGEDVAVWTATGALPAGTIVTLNFVSQVTSSGTLSNAASPEQVVLSGIGDQLFAFQGVIGSPTLLTGVHSNINASPTNDANWDNIPVTGNQISQLPDVLSNGTNAIRLHNGGVEVDNWEYDGVTNSGDKATLTAAINNLTNWNFDATGTTSYGAYGGTFTVAPTNAAPAATAPSAPTVNEDDTNVALANDIQVTDTDGDNQTVTFTITGGTVTVGATGITFGGSGNGSASFTAAGTLAAVNTALDAATFTPTPGLNGTNAGTIQFKSNDGTIDSNTASITFNINAVNDAPIITNLNGDSYTYNQGAGITDIDQGAAATLSDVENPADLDGGNLTVSIFAGEDAVEDLLSFNAANVTLSGTAASSTVTVSATVIGTINNAIAEGNDLIVTFNANATLALVQTLIQNITYENTDVSAATTGARTVRVTVDDNDGGSSTSLNNDVTITVACPAPSAQATSAVFGTETASTLDLTSWTAPAGGATGYAVYINSVNTFTAPSNGDEPVADLSWNAAGQQPIYFGTSISPALTISGLSASTTYFFQVYSYNGCGTVETYETTGLNASDITAAATAPTITNATWSDQNSDGNIDRVVLTFNQNVDITDGNAGDGFSAFLINDGAAVTLDNADYAGTNVGALTLTFTGGNQISGTSIAGLTATYDNAGANAIVNTGGALEIADAATPAADTDAAAPQIADFEYQDNDANGMIDQFVVSFSETLDAASVLSANDLLFTNNGDFNGSLFGADGTDLIVGAVSNVTVVLGTESTVIDTEENSAAIAISSQNGFSLTDGTNTNSALGAQSQAVFSDGAAPQISDFEYQDNDVDGMIDRFVVSFSETLDAASVLSANDLLFTNDGDFNGSLFGADGTDLIVGAVSNVAVVLGTESTVIDTEENSAAIAISSQNGFSLTDGTNTNSALGAQSQASFSDGAGPIILSAVTADNDLDGQIDRITLTFSENIDDGNSGAFGAATVDVAGYVGETKVSGDDDNAEVIISFTESGSGDTGATPTITLNSGQVEDASTIAIGTNQVFAGTADGAAPQITDLEYQDNDLDAMIDQFVVSFSETLDAASVLSANDLTLTNVGDFTSASFGTDGTDLLIAAVSQVTIVLGTESSVLDTENNGTLAISTQNGFSLTDGANSNSTLAAQTQASFSDGAAPQIIEFQYQDNDSDGMIDQFTINFSETLDAASVLSANDLILSNVGDFTSASFGTDGTDLLTGAVSQVIVVLGTESTVPDTEENSATIAISSQNAFSLTDGTNTNSTLIGQTQASFIDAADPVVIDVNSATAAGTFILGGNIAIDVNFSEAVVVMGIPTLTLETGATDVIVNFSGGSTTATLAFSYTVVAGNVSADLDYISTAALTAGTSIQDAAGNDADRTLASPGAANSLGDNEAFVVDGTVPTFVNAHFYDISGDGNIDEVVIEMSEGVEETTAEFGDFTLTGGSFSAVEGFASTGNSLDISASDKYITLTASLSGTGTANVAYDDAGAGAVQLADANGNESADNATISQVDAANPIIEDLEIFDTDNDGFVDQINITFSENIDTDDGTAPVFADIGALDLPDGVTITTAPTISDPGGATNIVSVTVIVDQVTENTAVDQTDLVLGSGIWEDNAGNALQAIATGTTSITDSALPILLSTSPTDGAGSFPTDGNLVFNFSEDIAFGAAGTREINLNETSPSPGTTETFDLSVPDAAIVNNVLTADPAAPLDAAADYEIYITTDAIDDLAGNSYAGITVSGDLDFTAGDAAPETCAHNYFGPSSEDADGNLSPSFCNTHPTSISSLVTTRSGAVSVLYFTVIDGSGGDDNMNSVIIRNGNTSLDWNLLFDGAELIDENGTSELADAINSNNITFSPATGGGDLGDISGKKEFALRVWFKTDLTTHADDVDGQNLVFQVNHGDLADVDKVLNGAGDQYIVSAGSNVESGNIPITVVATDYAFLQQPQDPVNATAIMTPAVTLEAVDVNGNRDLGYNASDAVQITTTGTYSPLYTAPTVSSNWVSGVGTVSDIVHTVVQAGRFLNTTGGTLTDSPTSTTFEVAGDGTPPLFVNSHFFDTNGDGNIDEIVVEMSEDIDESSITSTDFSVGAAAADIITGYVASGSANNSLDGSESDQYFTLQASVAGTTTKSFGYTQGTLDDNVGNLALTNASITTNDLAAPVFIAAHFFDAQTVDGSIDEVVIEMSEAIDDGSINPAEFLINAANPSIDVSISNPLDPDAADDQYFTLAVGISGTSTFTTAYTAGGLTDNSSNTNAAATNAAVTENDQASPIIITSISLDRNMDGNTDAVELEFSESIKDITFSLSIADWEVSSDNFVSGDQDDAVTFSSTVTSAALTGGGSDAGFDDEFVSLRWTPTNTSGTSAYHVNYTNGGDDITDNSSNTNAIADISGYAATDGALPIFLSTRTNDNSGDGFIDQIIVRFSDPIDMVGGAQVPEITDFTVANYTVTGVESAAGAGVDDDEIILTVVQTVAGTYDTNVTPNVTLSASEVVDVDGNLVGGNTLTASDRANPAFISSTTADINGNGQIDQITILFSEDVDAATIDEIATGGFDDFSVAGYPITAVTPAAGTGVDDNEIVLVVTESGSNDTGAVPDVTVNGSQVDDTSGNTSLVGVIAAIDGAPIKITDATWSDFTADGSIDRVVLTFSEAVDISDGIAADGFDGISINSGAITIDNDDYFANATTSLTLNFTTTQITGTGIAGLTIDYVLAGANNIIEDGVSANEMADSESPLANTDNATPIAANVSIASDNVTNTSRAITSNTVTLTFTVDDDLSSNPAVLFKSGGANINNGVTINAGAAPTYTASYDVNALDIDGAVTFTIDFTDDASNAGTQVTAVSGTGSTTSVTVDNTDPTVVITRNAPAAGSVDNTNSNTLSFDLAFSETMAPGFDFNDITLNLSGASADGLLLADLVDDTGGNYTLTVSNVAGDGTLGITIVAAGTPDEAGNTLASDQVSSLFTVDNTAPTVTINQNAVTSGSFAGTNDTSISFDIAFSTAIDNSTFVLGDVTIVNPGAVVLGTPMLSADGDNQNYTYTIPVTSGDGALSVSMAAGIISDVATNGLAALVTSNTISIDNTAPTAVYSYTPATLATNGSSVVFTIVFDSDFDNSSLATTDFTVNATGSGYGSVALVNTVGNTFTYTVNGIVGSGTIGVELDVTGAQDLAGNNLVDNDGTNDGVLTSSVFTIDQTAEITINTVEGDDYINAAEAPTTTISGTVTDVEDGQTVSVTLTDGTNSYSTSATIAAGVWQVTDFNIGGVGAPGVLLEGNIDISVSVTDVADNTANATRNDMVIYDATATIAFDATLEGDNKVNASEDNDVIIRGTTTGVSNGQTVTIDITDAGNANTIQVTGTVNNNVWVSSEADLSGFNEGALDIDITVTDVAGNVASIPNNAQLAIDRSASITIDATLMTDDRVNDSEDDAVLITGTTSDVDAEVDDISVSISDGSTTVQVDANASAGSGVAWSIAGEELDITSLLEGIVTVSVTVTDDAGNVATASKALTYDKSATVTLSSPIEGDNYINNTESSDVVVAGTTTGVENGQTVTVSFTDGATTSANFTTTISSNAWTINATPAVLSSGYISGINSITVNVSVPDVAGNTATTSATVTLDQSVAIAITTFNANVNASQDNSIAVSGTTDAEDGQTVSVNFDDSTNDLTRTTTASGGNWSVTAVNVSGLDDGTITITADVGDVAGNTAQDTETFSLDKSANISITDPLEVDNVINDSEKTTVIVRGTSSGIEAAQGVDITFADGTTTVNPGGAEASVDATGNWTFTFDISATALLEDDITITVTSADVAGNPATATKTIHYDPTATVAITTPISTDDLINASEDGALVISGTSSDIETGQTVTITFDDANAGTAAITTTAIVSSNIWTAIGADITTLDEGSITVSASVADVAGNAASDAKTVTLDQSASVAINTIEGDDRVNGTEATANITIGGTTTGIEDARTITVTITDGVTTLSPTTTISSNAWSATTIDLSTLTEGTIDVSVSVSDVSGNTAESSTTFTLDRLASLAITTPIETDDRVSIAESTTVMVSGTTNNIETGRTVTIVFTDGASATLNTTATISGGAWSTADFDLSTLQDGSISISATVSDVASNSATDTESIDLDLSAAITVTTPIEVDDKVNATEDGDIEVSGTVTDIEDGQVVTVSFDDANASTSAISANATIAAGAWTSAAADISSLDDGTITISISVSDLAGNPAPTSANVELDNGIPIINTVSLSTNNGTDNQHGANGNVVTLTLDFDDDLSVAPVVSLFSGGVAVVGARVSISETDVVNDIWTATYTVSDLLDTEGNVTFTVDFTDDAGNAGAQVTSVTNSSSVEIDFVAPILTNISLSTNNGTDNQHGKEGDVVTLSFTASDDLSATPVVSMSSGGVAVAITVGGTAPNYTATYTVAAADTDGAVTFTINYTDDAGNAGVQETTTDDGTVVEIDKVAPTLTLVELLTDNGTDDQHGIDGNVVTLKITASEDLSAIPTVTFLSGGVAIQGTVSVVDDAPTALTNFTATYTVDGDGSVGIDRDADGAVAFSINFIDDAGNSGAAVSATTNSSAVEIDNSIPTLTSVSIASNNTGLTDHAKAGNTITLSFTSSDELSATPTVVFQSGAAAIANGVTVTNTSGNNYTASYAVAAGDTDGVVSYTIDFIDDAGLVGSTVSATTDATVVEVDKAAPVLTNISLSTNNGTDTQHAIAGNTVTLSFTVDDDLSASATLPSVDFLSGGSAITNGVTVTNTSGNDYTATYDVDAADTDGTVTFTIDYTDDAGNDGTQETTTDDGTVVEIDKVAPTLTTVTLETDNGTDDQHGTDGNVVTLNITSSEDLSAIPTVTFLSGGVAIQGTVSVVDDAPTALTNFTATYTVDGTGSVGIDRDADGAVTFSINFIDDAGNSGSAVSTTTNSSSVEIDTNAPTVTFTNNQAADPSNTSPVVITATFDEDVTGLTDSDFTVTNGIVSSLTGSGSVYTIDITPDNPLDANISIVLNASSVVDDAGNTNAASSLYNVDYDNIAPVIISSAIVEGREISLTAQMDEPGTIYYVVVADGVLVTDSLHVKNVIGAAASPIASGSITFTTGGINIIETITLDADRTKYELYLVSEDNVDSKNLGAPQQLPIQSGGVTINTPSLVDICLEGDFFQIDPIVIIETIATDFNRSASNRTIVLELPENFVFQDAGTVTATGGDVSIVSSSNNSAKTTLTITYAVGGETNVDILTIADLMVQASGSVVSLDSLTRTGGNGDIYGINEENLPVPNFAYLTTIAPFAAPAIVTMVPATVTSPYIHETDSVVLGDYLGDGVTVYRKDSVQSQGVANLTPMTIGTVNASDIVKIYSDESLTTVVQNLTGSVTYSPSLLDLGLTDASVGVNTFWITVTDGKSCESAATKYGIAIIRLTNSAATTTFSNSDQVGSIFRFSRPSGSSATINGDALVSPNNDDPFSSPVEGGYSVKYLPTTAGPGRDTLKYSLTNASGQTADYWISLLVNSTDRVFNLATVGSAGLCTDIDIFDFDVIYVTDVDFDGIETGSNPDFNDLRVFLFENGSRSTEITSIALSETPPIVPNSSRTVGGWQLDLDSIQNKHMEGDDYSLQLDVVMYISDEGTGTIGELSSEVITIFRNPTVTFQNLTDDSFYCEDDEGFDVKVQIISAAGTSNIDINDNGYLLSKWNGTEYITILNSDTVTQSGYSSARLNLQDLNTNGDSTETETGMYKIVYTSANYTLASCATTIESTFELLAKPDRKLLNLANNIRANRGEFDATTNKYTFEYCEEDTFDPLDVTLGANQKIQWYRNEGLTNSIPTTDATGASITNEELFGTGTVAQGGENVSFYYVFVDNTDKGGGCASEFIEVNYKAYRIPSIPVVNTSIDDNDMPPVQSIFNAGANQYEFNYCVDGQGAQIAGIHLLGLDSTDSLVNPNTKDYYILYASDQTTPLDTIRSQSYTFRSQDINNGNQALAGTSETFYISRVENDSTNAGLYDNSNQNLFAGCTSSGLVEIVVNVFDTPSNPVLAEFTDNPTLVNDVVTYYMCSGDDLPDVSINPSDAIALNEYLYEWYTDDMGTQPITIKDRQGDLVVENDLNLDANLNFTRDDDGTYSMWVRVSSDVRNDASFIGCASGLTQVNLVVFPVAEKPIVTANESAANWSSTLPETLMSGEVINVYTYCVDATDGLLGSNDFTTNITVGSSGSASNTVNWYLANDDLDGLASSNAIATGSSQTAAGLLILGATSDTINFAVVHTENIQGTGGVNFEGCFAQTTYFKVIVSEIPETEFSFDGIVEDRPTRFYFYDEVNTVLDPTDGLTLELTDVLGNPIQTYVTNTLDPIAHTFTDPNDYIATVTIKTETGCTSTISRRFRILENLVLSSGHKEAFEGDNGGWFAEFQSLDGKVGSLDNPASANSWEWGVPNGTQIQTQEAIAGNEAWVTNLAGAYNKGEESFVYSPSFNIVALDNPVIKFNTIRKLDSKDGVVFQYSIDNGINWVNVGSFENSQSSGVEWFNAKAISATPGNTGVNSQGATNFNDGTRRYGWSDSDVSSVWRESIHSLVFPNGSDLTNVRFRFALAANNDDKSVEGFGFDNMEIFDLEKTVLVEQFSSTLNPNSPAVLGAIPGEISFDDVMFINYFTDFSNSSGNDILNLRNRSDPGARAEFYEISSDPNSVLDGDVSVSSNSLNWESSNINRKSLRPVEFRIQDATGDKTNGITYSVVDNKISATARFVYDPEKPAKHMNLSFHFAIVEKIVPVQDIIDDNSISTLGSFNDADTIYNVLRMMSPNAAGTSLSRVVQPGEVLEYSMTWPVSNVYNVAFQNNTIPNIRVIAFVQSNIDTEDLTDANSDGLILKEVLQSAYVDIDGLTANVLGLAPISDFSIYPNPGDEEITVEFDEIISKETDWVMYDQAGREVLKGAVGIGTLSLNIETKDIPSGIYLFHIYGDGKQQYAKRVVIVH